MITKLAIWYLRKNKASVLIGYTFIGGKIKAKNDSTYVYDNVFVNTEYEE